MKRFHLASLCIIETVVNVSYRTFENHLSSECTRL
jgi:hypothetical protein